MRTITVPATISMLGNDLSFKTFLEESFFTDKRWRGVWASAFSRVVAALGDCAPGSLITLESSDWEYLQTIANSLDIRPNVAVITMPFFHAITLAKSDANVTPPKKPGK